jgi:hypothetical protein
MPAGDPQPPPAPAAPAGPAQPPTPTLRSLGRFKVQRTKVGDDELNTLDLGRRFCFSA